MHYVLKEKSPSMLQRASIHLTTIRPDSVLSRSDNALMRGVEESGCALARPDRFVAWRAQTGEGDCAGVLESVVRSILCR
jgi:hypothetical protein